MINNLLLLSGNDIPFAEARLSVRQPRIKEIAYLGEHTFFDGCELLNFSKDILSEEDKTRLVNQSNFQILMSIIRDKKTLAIQSRRIAALSVITLLFPSYHISIEADKIILAKEEEEEYCSINNDNFEQFKEILNCIFALKKKNNAEGNYNPQGELAKQIADKLKKGRDKAAEAKGEQLKETDSILARYISILVTGQQMTYNEVMDYTIYQLFDAFERFELKETYDAQFSARLAGAKGIDEMVDWRKELH